MIYEYKILENPYYSMKLHFRLVGTGLQFSLNKNNKAANATKKKQERSVIIRRYTLVIIDY